MRDLLDAEDWDGLVNLAKSQEKEGVDILDVNRLMASETLNRVDLAPDTARRVIALMHPGSTMVVTDHPSNEEHRTDPGFTIITHDS